MMDHHCCADLQIPVLAAMLSAGFMAKAHPGRHGFGSMDAGLGPTALFSIGCAARRAGHVRPRVRPGPRLT